jgi:hypothetical protein
MLMDENWGNGTLRVSDTHRLLPNVCLLWLDEYRECTMGSPEVLLSALSCAPTVPDIE